MLVYPCMFNFFTAFIVCAHVFPIEELLVHCEVYFLQQQIGFPQQKYLKPVVDKKKCCCRTVVNMYDCNVIRKNDSTESDFY